MTKTERFLVSFFLKSLKIIFLLKLLIVKSLVVFWESFLRAIWAVIKVLARETFHVDKKTLPWWFWSVSIQVFIASVVPWYVWDYCYYSVVS